MLQVLRCVAESLHSGITAYRYSFRDSRPRREALRRDDLLPRAMPSLTDNQVLALAITERISSCVSILGIIFILATYLFSRSFNKPINRLIFFASWGNLGDNIGTLISQAGPAAGQDSALCQLQGFLIQM